MTSSANVATDHRHHKSHWQCRAIVPDYLPLDCPQKPDNFTATLPRKQIPFVLLWTTVSCLTFDWWSWGHVTVLYLQRKLGKCDPSSGRFSPVWGQDIHKIWACQKKHKCPLRFQSRSMMRVKQHSVSTTMLWGILPASLSGNSTYTLS